VELRAADGFFRQLPDTHIPCSMALDATCSDDSGSVDDFYDFLFALPAVKCRQTNVDLIPPVFSAEGGSNDYVIVHPFFCGVTV